MMFHHRPAIAAAIALSLGLGLSGCGGATTTMANRSLYSVNQPVVETRTYALDLAAGNGSLPLPERQRLAEWFEALDIGYGDRITVEGFGLSDSIRAEIAAIAARHGSVMSDAAPVSAGGIAAGSVRVTVSRASAAVPGCPDWTGNPGSATSNGYGCAINGNLAAMIADPQHLLDGATNTGNTVAMTSNEAIASYREQPTTGASGLSEVASQE
jgi:pilus assembly protein CpaD